MSHRESESVELGGGEPGAEEPGDEEPGAGLSVLLPVRNGERTLPAALRSIQRQSFTGFECIVVDDGSADASAEVVRRVAGEDGRFRLLSTVPRGIVPALVLAAESARTQLFARHDADDTSHPERFALQMQHLRAHPATDLVSTQVTHSGAPLTDGGQRYADWVRSCRTAEEIARGLWTESPLPHPTVMFRREIYERSGGYRDVGWPEDYDLWLRMLRQGARFAKIDRELYSWTDAPGRASRTLPQYAPERFLACRAHHLAAFLGDRPTIVWGAGRDGRRFARSFLAEGGVIERFLDIDPRKIGRRAQGRPIEEAETGLAARRTEIVLVAVGARGARELIRSALVRAGCAEGEDFFCVA